MQLGRELPVGGTTRQTELDPDPSKSPRVRQGSKPARARRWPAIAGAVLFAGILLGYSAAASITVLHVNETGEGAYASSSGVNGWTWLGVSYWTTPSPAPTQLSHTVGAPTVLGAASGSYTINAGTAGHAALSWNYTEQALLPISTEFEFTFKVGTSALPSLSIVKAYIETQFLHLFALNFDLFFDLGTGSSTSLPIDTIQVTVQQCSSVGTCP
ncbi:MAG: hypothetical protein L3K07_03095 [Thermoplasmata archaeon]|nr:hypothetical protein [Thermoplasmata archaeon]